MRNLKRALSLALASVMLLGMMVVGTGASYADVDSADNVEAIEVLQAVNVMSGDDKGNFNPDQVVTRAEMAVIICKMLYGDKLNVSQFAGANVFSDVPAWAQGFVNLAASLDIVAGVGDGKFAPNEPVTTAQATLMLCKALGYFQNPKEFGSDWALAAITKGTQLDLFDDMVLGTHEGLTRNNVAELTFNALANAVPVEYNEMFDAYYTAGRSWTVGVEFRYVDTLGYKNLNLVNQKDSDDFGRPGMTWGIGKYTTDMNGDIVAVTMDKEIVTETNDPIAVYTASMTKSSKASEVEKALKNYTINTTVGSENRTEVVTNGSSVWAADATIKTNVIDNTANGVTVEVYAGAGDANSAKIITDIVVIQPEKAEVAAINTTKGTVTLIGEHTVGNIVIEDDSDFYNTVKNLKVEDVVFLTAKDKDNVLDLYIPQAVTGTISQVKVNTDADKIAVVNGNSYTVSARAGSDFNAALAKQATVYLDKNGYALYVDTDSVDVPNYLYVTNVWQAKETEHGIPTLTNYVRGVNAEGEIVTLKIANGIKRQDAAYDTTTEANNNNKVVDAENFGTIAYATTATAGKAYTIDCTAGATGIDSNGKIPELSNVNVVTGNVGTIVEYVQGKVDTDLYVLVAPAAGNTTSPADGIARETSAALLNTAKKVNNVYLSTGVKFVFVNYNATTDKLTATIKDGVQPIVASTTYDMAVYTNPNTDEQLITTVFVSANFVNDEEIYYVKDVASYTTKYTDADGKQRTGYIADVYLNGVKVDNAILYNDYGTGFFRLDKMDGEALKLTDATGDYATEGKPVTNLYNNLLTTSDGQSYDVSKATVVDVTGDYAGIQISGIKSLMNSNYDVRVSVQFKTEGTDKVASYVYVTKVVEPDATGISATGYNFYSTVADAVANAKTMTAGAVTLAPVTDNSGATITARQYQANYTTGAFTSSGNFESGTTASVASQTMVIAFTVKAADGVTTNTYYTAVTGE